MSPNTNTKTPNPSNPSSLKPRYEIRKLGPEHFSWVCAVIVHGNSFHSPLWPVIYPEKMTSRLHEAYSAMEYLVTHQIESDLSFGVFDTEYVFKREESKGTGGKLYWDSSEKDAHDSEGLEQQSERLLEQMDFPLVSVALSYDAINPLDMEKMAPLLTCLPHFGLIYYILESRDTREPSTWKPTAANQVLFRASTVTRRDYEGEKIMAGLARWLMREADARGFRAIQIECVHDAVTHVWSKPPEPYKGSVVSEFHTQTYEDDEGKKPFQPAKVRITKCYVDLKPNA